MKFRFVRRDNPLDEPYWFTQFQEGESWYMVDGSLSFTKETARQRFECISTQQISDTSLVVLEESP